MHTLGTAVRSVHVIVPADVDDTAAPSGGNTYDRRVCAGLARIGWSVNQIPVAGSWPQPDAAARVALARSLDTLPDGAVVLMDGLVVCGVPEVVVPEARRLRLVVLVHMPLADEPGLVPAVAADFDARERATLHAATAVVATSPWAARRLVAHHGLAEERVYAAAPGTDPAPVAPGTDGASHLLCVAAVTPGKGQDMLVEALAAVADLPWSCVLVGALRRNPDYVGQVRELIERHSLGDRVRLVGPSAGDRLNALYAAADLLVLASRTETFGMVLTEALARGIPVLTTAVGALPDTLGRAPDGTVPGLLVPPGDVPALSAALRRWFGDQDLRDTLRSAALHRRAAIGGWAATSRTLAGVLDRLGGRSA
ncbi:MAG TPA: glycosyltransferase family 4 protein [Pseudonocardiaceae bacterium]|nr:glycosyltransferase family 4 protein [Pseudonocardiaceae bacterium]